MLLSTILFVGISLRAYDWALYLIIEAEGTLELPAHNALRDLETVCMSLPDDQVKISVDLIKTNGIERYDISKAGCILISVISSAIQSPPSLTVFKEGARAAFACPAERTGFIFSGHGVGMQMPNMTYHVPRQQPAFFYSDLSDLITFISSDLLKGKKLDFVGFDACHMASLEIAYDLKKYVRFVCASQEAEEKEGWNYRSFIALLTPVKETHTSLRQFVYAHDAQQRIRGTHHYSLSLLDLMHVDPVVSAIDSVVSSIHSILEISAAYDLIPLLYRARRANQRFSLMPDYADIIAFFEATLEEIDLITITPEIDTLRIALITAIEKMNGLIIAHVAGKGCPLASGCSFYFPHSSFDSSLNNTSFNNTFASEHGWYSFLKIYTNSLKAHKGEKP